MAEKKAQPVTIDGKEYQFEDMTDEQKYLLDNVVDLDRKIASNRFAGNQLQVGRDAFFNMLKTALEKKEEAKE